MYAYICMVGHHPSCANSNYVGTLFLLKELEPNANSDLYYITHFPLAAEPVSAFMVTNK